MAKLFLICGHGAGDSGATGGGYTEADLVRKLAKRIKALGGSAVEVGDTSVNWYASNYIGKGKCPKGVPVIELHMDSAGSSARGGHVIIKKGLSADKYDKALEKFIKSYFPGRSVTISKRSDLANPNRAAAKGINYRLLECCFISNKSDRTKFINNMDEVAEGILSAFGIASSGETTPAVEPEPEPKPETKGIDEDGKWGSDTTRLLQKVLGTYQDGVVDSQWKGWKADNPGLTTGWDWVSNAKGSKVIKAIQKKLGVDADGKIGPKTINALIKRYKSTSGATVLDGKLDYPSKTIKAMQKSLNKGKF